MNTREYRAYRHLKAEAMNRKNHQSEAYASQTSREALRAYKARARTNPLARLAARFPEALECLLAFVLVGSGMVAWFYAASEYACVVRGVC